jgi:hypothetical protein
MDSQVETERVGVIVVHGVGETEPGWSNEFVVDRLSAHCPELVPEPYSEAYHLDDRGRTKTGSHFPAYVRRARLGPRHQVSFLELYWADLSKTAAGPASFILASLRLFYEAPFILAHSFLLQNRSGYHWLLKQLVLTATWLLRWPIAGMNTTTFVAALAVIGLHRADLMPKWPLAITLCIILALIALAGFVIARLRMHHDLWLTDVAFATALFSLIAIACIGLLYVTVPGSHLAPPDAFLALCLPPILYIWVAWSGIIALAIAMMVPIYLKRLVGLAPKKSFPLGRPAAALGLVLLQGLIWKVFVSLPSVALITEISRISQHKAGALGAASGPLQLMSGDLARCAALPTELVRAFCRVFEQTPSDVLLDAVHRLKGVFVFNSLLALYTLALFIAVIILRAAIARLPKLSLKTKNRLMPRVIMSQAIILFLFLGSLLNLYIYAAELYASPLLLEMVPGVKSVWLGPPLLGVAFAVLYFFNVLQSVAGSMLHTFRDVVDHQYRPRFDSLKFLMPKTIRTKNRWPRRARIQERMNVLVERLVRENRFDRIVFVAHSQGSVVLYEYLLSKEDDEDLARVGRIDVVTVGSPLTHLYQYYFEEYGRARPEAGSLNPKLATWTNLWRLDDPIGNSVDILAGGFVQNLELGLGGHVDYWREPKVCQTILDQIAPGWKSLSRPAPALAPLNTQPALAS